MAVNPPPIQEKVATDLGMFPKLWVSWFYSIINYINGHSYWFDDNDVTTQSTPISHTGGATNTYLTNDSAGAYTNQYNFMGFKRIWDATNNQFDFSQLKIGDSVFFRFDTNITLAANNQEFDLLLDVAIGSGSDYSLDITHRYYKALGDYHITALYEIYIGNQETLNYPAKLRFSSADNASIKVNGWYTRIQSI